MPAHFSKTTWLWALLPLLLAAFLAIPQLGSHGFVGDEPASLIAAGILSPDHWSLADTWNYIYHTDPDQALGWPMLLLFWNRLVGWSEVAVRALPLFLGLLTLASIYRTGKDLQGTGAGLVATLLLGASVFFLAYTIHARVFTLVTFCTVVCVWSYWRIALHARPAGKREQAGLLLGSAGLFYTHYFCILFLPALGLFHLIFIPKNRRWWRPVLLIGLAALLAAPQLPVFLRGLHKTASAGDRLKRALSAPGLVSRLIHHMSNGLVQPSDAAGQILIVCLLIAIALLILRQMRTGRNVDPGWPITFTTAALLIIVTGVNEVSSTVNGSTIRYLMPLWPLTALLAGALSWRLYRHHRRLVSIMLALWVLSAAFLFLISDFRREFRGFIHSDFYLVWPLMREHFAADDLLVLDNFAANKDSFRFFVRSSGLAWVNVRRYEDDPYAAARPPNSDHLHAWLIYLSKNHGAFADMPRELGRVFCQRALDEYGFTLERYALHSVDNCPKLPERLSFDSDIQLTAPAIRISDGLLRLEAHFHSADEQLLARYSLAVHVIDSRSGERVAQGDTGVGPGAIAPLRSDTDVSGLPPGEYEVRVALYDWQTGARLSARDLETGEFSDIHTLYRFSIE